MYNLEKDKEVEINDEEEGNNRDIPSLHGRYMSNKGYKNGDVDGDTCQIKSEMEMKI